VHQRQEARWIPTCSPIQKGGVGKTTVTLGVASTLVSRGARVLLVDLDPAGLGDEGARRRRSRMKRSQVDEAVVWRFPGEAEKRGRKPTFAPMNGPTRTSRQTQRA
jgi:hypothetical protein